jgi:integrase
LTKTGLLTDRDVRNAKPEEGKKVARLLDGDRLYLFASVSLAAFELYEQGGIKWKDITDVNKTWVLRYQLDEVRHDYGIGPYPTVSLAEARRRAAELRLMIIDGKDPMQAKKDQRAERKAKAAAELKRVTFAECNKRYYEVHAPEWKDAKHCQQWESTMRRFVLPVIGKLNADDIDSEHVVKILEPIWKTVTGSRVQNRIKRVFDFAIACNVRTDKTNPADRSLIKARLGKAGVSNGHHEAMPVSDAPAFMQELRAKDSVAARALELCILTATRTSETVGANWSEIDFSHKLWTIPGERMKAGREHRVPLSDRAVEVLKALHKPHATGPVFINGNNQPLANNALLLLLRSMHGAATTHGFRSTFRDWLGDRTNYPRDLGELCLAHAVGDATEQAYRRGTGYQKRCEVMQRWCDFLARPLPKTGDVVEMRKRERA